MMCIDFEGSNMTFVRPESMTDEECYDIRAFKGIDCSQTEFILTVWQPSKEDIEAINAGRPICLKVCGQGMPPVALYTYDENIQPNI